MQVAENEEVRAALRATLPEKFSFDAANLAPAMGHIDRAIVGDVSLFTFRKINYF